MCMHWECQEHYSRHRLQRKPLVSEPGMHHGTCHDACRDANLRWWGKCSWHSRRRFNPQFYISGNWEAHACHDGLPSQYELATVPNLSATLTISQGIPLVSLVLRNLEEAWQPAASSVWLGQLCVGFLDFDMWLWVRVKDWTGGMQHMAPCWTMSGFMQKNVYFWCSMCSWPKKIDQALWLVE